MNQKRKGDNPLRAAALVGVMGLDIAVCIFLGYWLANRLLGDSQGGVVLGIIGGLAVGILSCVFLLKRALGDSDG